MSGSIIETHKEALKGYHTSKGTLRFQPDEPLSYSLVEELVRARIAEIER